ncbi:MAG: hypothetical protein EA391_01470 [Balneolaceae bacterium]|nr:MAG: hypothetical protein EA391_01470 [Balneolaceae bacterium]
MAFYLVMAGLFTMLVHPVTHVFETHNSEHHHQQNELPSPDQNSDDCIECVLTTASALDKPASDTGYLPLSFTNQFSTETSSENQRIITGFSLRGPPSFLYMS